MEYTTYSIFTKGENPFEAFIRTKRDAASIELPEHFYQYQDDEIMEQEYRDSSSDSKQAQIETIKVNFALDFSYKKWIYLSFYSPIGNLKIKMITINLLVFNL